MEMKNLFNGWSKFEIAWLVISTSIILGLSVMWDDTLIGTISSLAGIISVVLCAKGKISYIYVGIIQCTLYGYIAYGYQLYGESMLNLLIFLPFNIFTIYVWKKNKKDKSLAVSGEDVVTRKLTPKQWMILIPSIIVASLLYALVLSSIGARQVTIDAFAVVLSIFAQILLTFRYVENWLIWILVNTLTVVLWILTLIQTGGNDWGVLVMWIAFWFNSVYAYFNWIKITKSNEVQ